MQIVKQDCCLAASTAPREQEHLEGELVRIIVEKYAEKRVGKRKNKFYQFEFWKQKQLLL